MHRSERIMQIKDILLDQGKVFVEDLCSRFEVWTRCAVLNMSV